MAKDLILQDVSGWDKHIIDSIFLPIDSHYIQQIPIINTNNKDEYMWILQN